IHLPIGVATNFVINGKEFLVPMALEEPSVIAAASKAAKQTLPEGFHAEADESIMIGQMQIVGVKGNEAAKKISAKKKEILSLAKEKMKPHEKYGCGVRDFETKILKTDRGEMLIIEFHVAVGDAQGANMINTLLEALAPKIEGIVHGIVRLRILSNLATKRRVRVKATWNKEVVGDAVVEGVLDAYEFAKNDIYRCATHNKGIMNGIDAVVLATGNDWRSTEAGAHAYAATKNPKEGYSTLTKFSKNKNGDLVGEIEIPLALGIVGPAVNSSPTAKIALKIANVNSSRELAMVAASVGLANNFAALAALSTVGIQQGHMKLHARSVAMYAGATNDEIDKVADILTSEKNFNAEFAREVLTKVRK
ncbi:hydroxymethylglutaryl-CoA reductase, degradative, partial [Candidatus Micrarchaeota archaeon]|nr:hydroxymethylglutaryl-CoA reductase, degradative [Candidatus Micrarchaeota archaeon]